MSDAVRQWDSRHAGRRCRIAHVALSLEVGGAEKLLVEFARHLDPRRYELHVFALTADGIVGEELRATGVPVTVLNGCNGIRPELVYRLARCLRRYRFDIVHTHLDRPHIYGTLAARLAGINRVVHTRHGQSTELTRRQRCLVRAVSSWTNCFVCVSDDVARHAVALHGISPRRVRTIHNGIPLRRAATQRPNRAGPVVNVGRLSSEKDWPTWLRAAALALKQDDDLQFVIAGDGGCRPRLEALARELGVGDRVQFLGFVNDVSSVLSHAGMFVSSSRSEGLSLALLEAQSHRLPVIATAVGGNIEVIQDGKSGLLVSPGDPDALAEAIVRLRSHPQLRQDLADAGWRRVQQRFNVSRMIRDYETVYDSLIAWRAAEVVR